TVTAGAAVNAVEGTSTGDIVIATFTDGDPGDHTASFVAVVDWGDATGLFRSDDANPTVSIVYTGDGAGQATYAVHSSHTYAAATTAGSPKTVKVDITDVPGGNTASVVLHATVTGGIIANTVHIAEISPPFQIGVGAGFVGQLGNFIDANPNAVAS